MPEMLELEEAQEKLLSLAQILPIERVEVEMALGRYLARNVLAARTQPSRNLSAMDGYAIGDGAGPWKLVGESRAGSPFNGEIGADETVRISTGAAIPAGADRVLIQENAKINEQQVHVAIDPPDPGQHVRLIGMDFEIGTCVLHAGTPIGPAQMALAISSGHSNLEVHRPPKVVVLDSGDELATSPDECGLDQIPASNGAMLAAMLRVEGCEVRRIGPVADEMSALVNALKQSDDADIIVTSGGASVGDHDLIKPVLEDWGAQLAFWKVAIKPGKPLIVAERGNQIILGLPGNPVSSFVTGFLFLLPLVRHIMGASAPLPSARSYPAAMAIPAGGSRREFLRGIIDHNGVRMLSLQDSSALANLALSNCLIDRPAQSGPVSVGEAVTIYPLENGGIA